MTGVQTCALPIYNGLDMSFTNQVLVDDNERVVDFREYRRIKDFENSKLLQYHLSKKITGTNTFMAKKSLLEKIGGFNGADMATNFILCTILSVRDVR